MVANEMSLVNDCKPLVNTQNDSRRMIMCGWKHLHSFYHGTLIMQFDLIHTYKIHLPKISRKKEPEYIYIQRFTFRSLTYHRRILLETCYMIQYLSFSWTCRFFFNEVCQIHQELSILPIEPKWWSIFVWQKKNRNYAEHRNYFYVAFP